MKNNVIVDYRTVWPRDADDQSGCG